MKKITIWLLIAALLMTGCVPALAAAGDRTLVHFGNSDGFSQNYIANVFVTLVVVWYSLPEALIVLVAKLLLSAAFVGVGQLLYAAPAGLVSLVVTFVLVKTLSKSLSIVAVNALSAVAHNLTQLLVFALVTNSNAWYLAPYMTIVGLIAGVLTGSAVYFTVKILPSKLLGREKE